LTGRTGTRACGGRPSISCTHGPAAMRSAPARRMVPAGASGPPSSTPVTRSPRSSVSMRATGACSQSSTPESSHARLRALSTAGVDRVIVRRPQRQPYRRRNRRLQRSRLVGAGALSAIRATRGRRSGDRAPSLVIVARHQERAVWRSPTSRPVRSVSCSANAGTCRRAQPSAARDGPPLRTRPPHRREHARRHMRGSAPEQPSLEDRDRHPRSRAARRRRGRSAPPTTSRSGERSFPDIPLMLTRLRTARLSGAARKGTL